MWWIGGHGKEEFASAVLVCTWELHARSCRVFNVAAPFVKTVKGIYRKRVVLVES